MNERIWWNKSKKMESKQTAVAVNGITLAQNERGQWENKEETIHSTDALLRLIKQNGIWVQTKSLKYTGSFLYGNKKK